MYSLLPNDSEDFVCIFLPQFFNKGTEFSSGNIGDKVGLVSSFSSSGCKGGIYEGIIKNVKIENGNKYYEVFTNGIDIDFGGVIDAEGKQIGIVVGYNKEENISTVLSSIDIYKMYDATKTTFCKIPWHKDSFSGLDSKPTIELINNFKNYSISVLEKYIKSFNERDVATYTSLTQNQGFTEAHVKDSLKNTVKKIDARMIPIDKYVFNIDSSVSEIYCDYEYYLIFGSENAVDKIFGRVKDKDMVISGTLVITRRDNNWVILAFYEYRKRDLRYEELSELQKQIFGKVLVDEFYK